MVETEETIGVPFCDSCGNPTAYYLLSNVEEKAYCPPCVKVWAKEGSS